MRKKNRSERMGNTSAKKNKKIVRKFRMYMCVREEV